MQRRDRPPAPTQRGENQARKSHRLAVRLYYVADDRRSRAAAALWQVSRYLDRRNAHEPVGGGLESNFSASTQFSVYISTAGRAFVRSNRR